MRIRTQFTIAIAFFGLVILGVAVSLLVTGQQIARLGGQEELARRLETNARDLSYLSNDYLLHGESQQAARWQAKYALFSADVASLAPDAPAQRALAQNINANRERLGAVFAEVANALQSVAQSQDSSARLAFTQMSWSRIEVQNQGLVFDAARLSQVLREEIDRQKQTTYFLIFVLAAAFGIYLATNFHMVYRRILRSLAVLHEGASIVGSGNLSFVIPVEHDDEIGALSHAFNRMTANLKLVTASKADLELEVYERKKAEENAIRKEAIEEAINRVLEGVMVFHTEEALGRHVLAVAERLTGSAMGFVGELHSKERLDDIAVSDMAWEACQIERPAGLRRVPTGFPVRGIYGRVLQDGKAFYTNEPAAHPDSVGVPAGHPPICSFLGVPLTRGGQTVGMVGLANRAGGYRPEDLEAMEALAPSIVQVFMRKRAEAERERLLEELNVKNEELQAQSEEIQAQNEELLKANGELAQATEATAEALRGRDEFLSVAAHELKTPVTSLHGFTQLLRRQQAKYGTIDVERLSRGLDVIDRQSHKLVNLVNQLLDMSRLEGGRLKLNRQSVDLSRLVEDVATAARLRTIEHTISLETQADVLADIDPLRIEQVVTNLVDNAIRYSPLGGPIEIAVGAQNGGAWLSVRDHGIGIPPEHRAHVFDRFYRAHPEGHVAGLGLGLFICRQIVELHGGHIELDARCDEGSCFLVTLPNGCP